MCGAQSSVRNIARLKGGIAVRDGWWRRSAALGVGLVATGALALQGISPTAAAAGSSNTLVILQSAAPVSLNPVDEADWNTRESIGYMYDPLIYAGPHNTYLPGLATSWTPSDHSMVWTIQLRHGVTFQDGTPFNAAAAVFNFDLNMNPTSKNYSDFKPYVKSVVATGPYTIRITLAQPYAELIDELTWAPLFISPTAYKKEGATGFAQKPVGTGAYIFQSYTPNSTLIMTANPHYWGGMPKIPTIKVEIVPDVHTEAVDMEAHTADFMYQPLPQDVAELKAHGILVDTTPTASGTMVSFNLANGPTADVQVRKAIMEAINRKAIVQVILKGYAELSRAGVPTTSAFYHANVPEVNYSPAQAKATLNADGWKVGKGGVRMKNGQPLDITILSNSNQPWPQISQIFQQELDNVGFHATITTQAWSTFLNSMRAGQYNIAYWYLAGFTLGSWDGTVNMESSAYWNVSQIKNNPQLKSVMHEIDSLYAKEIGESNTAQRSATLLKFQELNAKYELVGWLWHPLGIFAISPQLHNYAFNNWLYLFLNAHSTLSG
jgi:peptide/nickel transport system substrate-binding protein